MHVLLVDDHVLVRNGLKWLIRCSGSDIEISEAGSYDEALRVLAQRDVAVIFLDYDLRSDHSGLDLLNAIREQGYPTRVVMLSASDDRETIFSCILAGASGYIPKSSSDTGVFQRAIERIFAGGVFLPDSVISSLEGPAGKSLPVTEVPSLDDLTPRLRELLFYVCQGLPNKAIANKMNISEGTVRKTYMPELFRYFNVVRRTELMIEVARRGIKMPHQLQFAASSGHLTTGTPVPNAVNS